MDLTASQATRHEHVMKIIQRVVLSSYRVSLLGEATVKHAEPQASLQ